VETFSFRLYDFFAQQAKRSAAHLLMPMLVERAQYALAANAESRRAVAGAAGGSSLPG